MTNIFDLSSTFIDNSHLETDSEKKSSNSLLIGLTVGASALLLLGGTGIVVFRYIQKKHLKIHPESNSESDNSINSFENNSESSHHRNSTNFSNNLTEVTESGGYVDIDEEF
jgi:cytoskeletal protein RodZ